MFNPRALLRDAFHGTRVRLEHLARKIVLAVVLGVCALAAVIYFLAAIYQVLAPSLGAAGADAAIAAALVLICLLVQLLLRRT